MLYIACHSVNDSNVDLNKIVENQQIPRHFLSKILQLLVRNKLLISMKGPTGGYRLSRKPDDIRLIDIVEAIDGLDAFEECGIFYRQCNENDPCPIHHEFRTFMNSIQAVFKSTRLQSMNIDDCDCNKNLADLIKIPRL